MLSKLKSIFTTRSEPADEVPIDKYTYLKSSLDAGTRTPPHRYIDVLIKHIDDSISKMEIVQGKLDGEFPPELLVSPDVGLFGIQQGDRTHQRMEEISKSIIYYLTIGLDNLGEYPTTQIVISPYNLRTYLRNGDEGNDYCGNLLSYLRTLKAVVNRFKESNNYYCFLQLRNHLYLYLHLAAIVDEVVSYHRKRNTWMDHFPTFN